MKKIFWAYMFVGALSFSCAWSAFAAVSMVRGGMGQTLALTTDGRVWGWGANDYGDIGDGTTIDRLAPVMITGIDNVKDIACGDLFSVALRKDGTLWAWGLNDSCQLGDVNGDEIHVPVPCGGGSGFVAISAGASHTMALKCDGTVWSWGSNDGGKLGNWTDGDDSPFPVEAIGLASVTAISAGNQHSLALCSDGTVWAWGANYQGQLGDGDPAQTRYTPGMVTTLNGVVAISGGGFHCMALRSDGTVWTWGGNDYGQLGDGTKESRPRPVMVGGLSGIVAVSAGWLHSMALKKDGTIWAWGDSAGGVLGDNNTTIDRLTPVQAHGISDVRQIAAADWNSMAIKGDGSVWAWGVNVRGSVGDGTTMNRAIPVQVSFAPVSAPSPSVLIQGQSWSATVTKGTPVEVELSMDAGDYAGHGCDWWILASVNNEWYCCSAANGWYMIGAFNQARPAYQGPLANITAFPLLNDVTPPVGFYTFYFGVDSVMDGVLDGQVYYTSNSLRIE